MIRKFTLACVLALSCGVAGPVLAQEEAGLVPATIEATEGAVAATVDAVADTLPATTAAAEAVEEAGEEAGLDTGDTAWMMTATALVLLMTIPGLSLFYAGMVRSKNVLSVLMQCFAITGLMSVIWTVYGYSIAFSTAGMEAGVVNLSSFIGGLDRAFMSGMTLDALSGTIPESVFATFQMTFAIITPALIVGAFAERMKFSSILIFMTMWVTVCYLPMVHMVWAGDGGLMWDWGVIDFAGGTVVHINAGIAGLVCAIMLGKRKGYGKDQMPPNNLGYTIMGAAMLWVGWFGFNAGSALAAGASAGMAMFVTQVATASAALAWMFAEWIMHKKPSVLGIASGAVAGLVAITPASGSAGPVGALWIGLASGAICFLASTKLKHALGYDDSLDVFGVHCVGGIVGAILTGVFCYESMGGVATPDIGMSEQVWIQTKSVLFTLAYSGVLSVVLLYITKVLTGGLRVDEDAEREGLDITQHNERGYIL